jgi:5-methylcytosine-specific restriction protein B
MKMISTPKDHNATQTDDDGQYRTRVNSMQLNQILYGPPGTGKTYNTSGKSLQLLNIECEETDIHNSFSSQCNEGKILFTTFHQSYSYEDFIEGIRVNTNGSQVEYKIRNGLFKKIARKALFQKAAHLLGEAVNQEHLETYSTTYAENLDEDLKIKNNFYSSEDVQKILKRIALFKSDPLKYCSDKIIVKNQPRFVIVIDEINRGNISKIFGELITLIEDNKRLGGRDVLSVTLPYSGEQFFVPDNLYILGTMNTADRSLAALDVALRRRFDFEEMMPNFDNNSPLAGIKVKGVDLCKWMTGVNQRIQAERGREFTIGHAFFMSLKTNQTMDELESIMQRKVLPLLEEYFFDDWEGIRYVLKETDLEGDAICFITTTDIKTRKGKLVKLYGWNKTALTDPAAYRS